MLHFSRNGFEGKLSIKPPSTYTSPSSSTGLKTTGTQHEARIAGINGPSVKYSTLPLFKLVAVMVTGIFKQLKLFSGMSFSKMSLSPLRFINPFQVHAGRRE